MTTDRLPTAESSPVASDVVGHLAKQAVGPQLRVASTTALSAPGRVLAGASALLVVEVVGDVPAPTPSGSVVAADERGEDLARGELDARGRALLRVALPLGDHVVHVDYAGDDRHDPSAASRALRVAVHPTLVTLAGISGAVADGEQVVLTATVRSDDAAPAPSGTVHFLDGRQQLGSALVGASGRAVLTTQQLGTGLHGIVAAYSGDGTHASARSTPMPQAVAVRTVVTRLSLERRPQGHDAEVLVRLVESVTGHRLLRATGEVLVHVDGLPEPLRLEVVEGAAAGLMPGAAVGRMWAVYSGDAEHAASDGSPAA